MIGSGSSGLTRAYRGDRAILSKRGIADDQPYELRVQALISGQI